MADLRAITPNLLRRIFLGLSGTKMAHVCSRCGGAHLPLILRTYQEPQKLLCLPCLGAIMYDWTWDRLDQAGRRLTEEIAEAEKRGAAEAVDELLAEKHAINIEKSIRMASGVST